MVSILVVDDESVVLANMSLMLKHPSREILTADSGSTALECLHSRQGNISLVILDLMMPEMHGLKVLEEMQKQKALAHIPVMLHTGLPDSPDAQKGVEMGAVSVLAKLDSMKEKRQAVEKVIELHCAPKQGLSL